MPPNPLLIATVDGIFFAYRRPRADRLDQIDAWPHRKIELRRVDFGRRFVVRRSEPEFVGQLRAPGGAAGEPAAMDGDSGEPRGGEDPGPPRREVHGVQRTVGDAFRGERFGFESVLFVRGRRRSRRDARVVYGLRSRFGAVQVAAGGFEEGGPEQDAVAAGVCTRAVVQQQ